MDFISSDVWQRPTWFDAKERYSTRRWNNNNKKCSFFIEWIIIEDMVYIQILSIIRTGSFHALLNENDNFCPFLGKTNNTTNKKRRCTNADPMSSSLAKQWIASLKDWTWTNFIQKGDATSLWANLDDGWLKCKFLIVNLMTTQLLDCWVTQISQQLA